AALLHCLSFRSTAPSPSCRCRRAQPHRRAYSGRVGSRLSCGRLLGSELLSDELAERGTEDRLVGLPKLLEHRAPCRARVYRYPSFEQVSIDHAFPMLVVKALELTKASPQYTEEPAPLVGREILRVRRSTVEQRIELRISEKEVGQGVVGREPGLVGGRSYRARVLTNLLGEVPEGDDHTDRPEEFRDGTDSVPAHVRSNLHRLTDRGSATAARAPPYPRRGGGGRGEHRTGRPTAERSVRGSPRPSGAAALMM